MTGLKLWIITICMVALIFALWYFSDILMLFLISAALAFLLSPPVNYLQRKMQTKKRILPTVIVFICTLALIAALLAILLPILYDQIVSVIKNIGQYASTITDFLDHIAEYAVELGLPESLMDSIFNFFIYFENFLF